MQHDPCNPANDQEEVSFEYTYHPYLGFYCTMHDNTLILPTIAHHPVLFLQAERRLLYQLQSVRQHTHRSRFTKEHALPANFMASW